MNPYDQYKQQSVQTSPEKLLLMLYEGGIRFAKRATQAIQDKNIPEANTAIQRTQDVVSELMCTLNMDYPISQNLMALYEYMNRRLMEANLKKDSAPIEEVAGYLTELRDTFAQAAAAAKSAGQAATTQISAQA